MKKYIEKAIKKGLIFCDIKIIDVNTCKKRKNLLSLRGNDEDESTKIYVFDYQLIKAVFKSLFGEELLTEQPKNMDSGMIGGRLAKENYKYHLQKWITSDLSPEDYLDKYYKE